jgi:hypothetical protein
MLRCMQPGTLVQAYAHTATLELQQQQQRL